MQRFNVGGVLSRAFSVWTRLFMPLTALQCVVMIPVVIAVFMLGLPDRADLEAMTSEELQATLRALPGNLQWFTAFTVLWAIPASMLVSAASTLLVFRTMQGDVPTIGDALSKAASRILPLLWLSIVIGFVVGIGFLLLIVPGLMALCAYYVAVPAAVIEKKSAGAAINRSLELTRGHRWQILGIVVLLFLITFVAGFVVGFVFPGNDLDHPTRNALINQLPGIVLGPLGAVAMAIAYHDLRVEKEGVRTEDLVATFG
jgi:hypothetical protein